MSDEDRTETLPWGETYPELARAILDDPAAPPVLALAAVRARLGDERSLRSLVADALVLAEQEKEQE